MALLRSFVVVVLAFSLLATACSEDEPTGVVFGEGEVPETVPDDFPIPDDARIDSTLIDYDRGVTEMLYIIPAEIPAVVGYYETNLPNAGYTIESSEGTLAEWTIVFSDADVDGTVVLRVGGVEITQTVARFTES
jgi:hypothetical protein